MNLITDDVKDFLHFLDEAGVKWVIAGGYARDMYYNRLPKDLDIHVVYSPEAAIIVKTYLQKNKLHQPFGSGIMYSGEIDRVCAVYKMVGDVDVVFWDGVSSVEEIINNFDLNMNQFRIHFEWGFEQPYSVYVGKGVEGVVKITRPYECNRIERIKKMMKIAGWLNWDYSDLEYNLYEQEGKYRSVQLQIPLGF